MSFIKNIIKKNQVKSEANTPEYIMEDFYIPDAIVLQKVNEREPLTNDEIKQYLNYIYFNYFMPQNSEGEICIFGGDFTKYQGDLEAIKARREDAKVIIIHQLAKGESIDTTYALWLSKNIYVDNDDECLKRVISMDDNGEFSVYPASRYFNVGKAVDQLHKELIDTMLSKDVANKL